MHEINICGHVKLLSVGRTCRGCISGMYTIKNSIVSYELLQAGLDNRMAAVS